MGPGGWSGWRSIEKRKKKTSANNNKESTSKVTVLSLRSTFPLMGHRYRVPRRAVTGTVTGAITVLPLTPTLSLSFAVICMQRDPCMYSVSVYPFGRERENPLHTNLVIFIHTSGTRLCMLSVITLCPKYRIRDLIIIPLPNIYIPSTYRTYCMYYTNKILPLIQWTLITTYNKYLVNKWIFWSLEQPVQHVLLSLPSARDPWSPEVREPEEYILSTPNNSWYNSAKSSPVQDATSLANCWWKRKTRK